MSLPKLDVQLDEKELMILASILLNEPTTAYRIAVENRMHFSYVYKKVERFEQEELVAYFCEPGNGRKLYYVLPKGILLLLSRGAVNARLVLDKLRDRWGLKDFTDDEIMALAELLVRNYKAGMPINDVVMMSYSLYTRYLAGDLTVHGYRSLLNKLFRRAFEALVGLIGDECLRECGKAISTREYV